MVNIYHHCIGIRIASNIIVFSGFFSFNSLYCKKQVSKSTRSAAALRVLLSILCHRNSALFASQLDLKKYSVNTMLLRLHVSGYAQKITEICGMKYTTMVM